VVCSVLIIRIERSGGVTGIPLLREMDGNDLPSDLINIAQKIVNDKEQFATPLKRTSTDGADYYSYKISVLDGNNRKIIKCTEYDIRNELKSLVKYVERHSKNHE
jgi:hypothetical protein